MDKDQIEVLWRAAQIAGLSRDELRGLSIANPFGQRGKVADRMKAAVSRIAPEQAQRWIQEAGASMSLAAKAAQLGYAEMTDSLRAEIEAFSPLTPNQAKQARIEQLIASNPFGVAGFYREDGSYVEPIAPNLTAAMELTALAPEKAAQLKAAAMPPQAQLGLSAEDVAFVNSQLNARAESYSAAEVF